MDFYCEYLENRSWLGDIFEIGKALLARVVFKLVSNINAPKLLQIGPKPLFQPI